MDNQPAISKKSQKKLAKRQAWLEGREERRRLKKEKRKQRRADGQACSSKPSRRALKLSTMETSSCQQRVAVDMAFDHLMTERDRQKLLNQLSYCYAVNRRAPSPLQFYIVHFDGSSRDAFDKIDGNAKWDVRMTSDSVERAFEKSDVVYLTSESPNCLNQLDERKVYVIGGLVDHNSHKGLCHHLALEAGVQHARLPIDEHMRLSSRRVLTVNQVFEILLRYTQTADWRAAFECAIPMRKRQGDHDGVAQV